MNKDIKNLDGVFIVGWGGMKEITKYIAHSLVYAIEYKNGFILIDCGNGFTGNEIIENVAKISKNPITHIFLTHCHYDHSLNSLFFKEKGVKIFAHLNTGISLKEKTYRVWYEYPHLVKPVNIDFEIEKDGMTDFEGIEFYYFYTPGHTDGCVSFLVKMKDKRFLFTGDLLMSDGEIGWAGSEDFNKEKLLNSLEKINEIDFDYMLGGHNWWKKDEGKENIRKGIKKGKEDKWKILKNYNY
jgi:glyoxylase-like metal-dependent hydrolase (beta-lactamase superfamily II)